MKFNLSEKFTSSNIVRCGLRYCLFAFGWINVAMGLIGILIPGIPTTVFLIIAVWAFSRCSERFHDWLWNHPRFGAPIQSWHYHRIIPKNAKIVASCMMTISFIYVAFFVAESWILPVFLAAVMIPAWIYIITCKSVPSAKDPIAATDSIDTF